MSHAASMLKVRVSASCSSLPLTMGGRASVPVEACWAIDYAHYVIFFLEHVVRAAHRAAACKVASALAGSLQL